MWNDEYMTESWYGRRDSISPEEVMRLTRAYGEWQKEGTQLRIKELESEVHRLREKAKKNEKEFKEFRKLKKAIKADSTNTKMARLVKRV